MKPVNREINSFSTKFSANNFSIVMGSSNVQSIVQYVGMKCPTESCKFGSPRKKHFANEAPALNNGVAMLLESCFLSSRAEFD